MISMERFNQVREAHARGDGRNQIARALKMSPMTVSKYIPLEQVRFPPSKTAYPKIIALLCEHGSLNFSELAELSAISREYLSVLLYRMRRGGNVERSWRGSRLYRLTRKKLQSIHSN